MDNPTGTDEPSVRPSSGRNARHRELPTEVVSGYSAGLLASAIAYWAIPLILYPFIPHSTALTGASQGFGLRILAVPFLIMFTYLVAFFLTIVPFAIACAVILVFRIQNFLFVVFSSLVMSQLIVWTLSLRSTLPVRFESILILSLHLGTCALIGDFVYWWIGKLTSPLEKELPHERGRGPGA